MCCCCRPVTTWPALPLPSQPVSWCWQPCRPSGWLALWRKRLPLGSLPDLRLPASLLSFAVFATLVAAGFLGSRDPLSNPLPLTVWTLVWVGLTLAQGLVGNLWRWLNPWYGPYRLVRRMAGDSGTEAAPLKMPSWVGTWPALVLFLAFAWFELIDPAPDDPARLAVAAGAYWLLSFVAMLAFGFDRWSRQGEFFSLFFAMIARFGVIEGKIGKGRLRLALCRPGAKLQRGRAAAAIGRAVPHRDARLGQLRRLFQDLLLARPQRHQPARISGRSALTGINSAGLAGMFALLAGIGLLAVLVGERLVRSTLPLHHAVGLMVWSIVPIALAYHFRTT